MRTEALHILCEFSQADAQKLDDSATIETALRESARLANVQVLSGQFHKFTPSGVTGVLCLSESHIAVHTWPAQGYAAVDIYTCGLGSKPELAIDFLRQALGARLVFTHVVRRGITDREGYKNAPQNSLDVNS